FCVAMLAIVGYLVWHLPDTKLGRAMRAVRDNELAAGVNGIDVFRTKVSAFAVCAVLGGLAGGLFAGGFAYVAEDHVLFSPQAMNAANSVLPRYGSLSKRSLDEMIAGARVDVAPYKRDNTDFVLWKPSKPGEPS
ncbi:ABC transporter permease subunit, partial [Escherichia coli]